MTTTTANVEPALDPLGRHPSYTSTRRIFRIIDLVSRSGDRLTVKALAGDLGISTSTCYQLMAILIDEGYVQRLSHNAGYRLGPTIGVLFHRSRKPGRTVVGPVRRDLAHRTRRAAHFAILSRSDRVLVTHVCSP